MTCEQCAAQTQEMKAFVYEDEKVFAMLCPEPAAKGHVWLMPKEHYPIFENVPDELVGHLFAAANNIAMALFEAMKAQGTNIIIQNGVAAGQEHPHFIINIIPRFENDGLSFQWLPKQLSEEQMSSIEMQLKEQFDAVTKGPREKAISELKQEVREEEKEEKIGNTKEEKQNKEETDTELEEEDYLIKHVRRIP